MQINITDQNEDTAVMKKKPRIRWWHVLIVFILVILLAFANLLLFLGWFGEKGVFGGELRRYTTFNAEQELKLKRFGYIPPELDDIDITLIKYEYLTGKQYGELHFLIKTDQAAERYFQYIGNLWRRIEKDDAGTYWGGIKDYYIFNWKKYNLTDIYTNLSGPQAIIYMCGDHNMTENRYYICFTSNFPIEIE